MPLSPHEFVGAALAQTYPACRNAAVSWATRAGAVAVSVDLPFPLQSSHEVVEAVVRGIGPRTRLALLDHVTSPTGMVLPVAELIGELRARGIVTLIDGAHAPGMVPLDLRTLGGDYYVGNLHKWCCGPKGTAFLWAERERQSTLRPLVVSHGMTAGPHLRPALQRPRSVSRARTSFEGTAELKLWPRAIRARCFPAGRAKTPGAFPGVSARDRCGRARGTR